MFSRKEYSKNDLSEFGVRAHDEVPAAGPAVVTFLHALKDDEPCFISVMIVTVIHIAL